MQIHGKIQDGLKQNLGLLRLWKDKFEQLFTLQLKYIIL